MEAGDKLTWNGGSDDFNTYLGQRWMQEENKVTLFKNGQNTGLKMNLNDIMVSDNIKKDLCLGFSSQYPLDVMNQVNEEKPLVRKEIATAWENLKSIIPESDHYYVYDLLKTDYIRGYQKNVAKQAILLPFCITELDLPKVPMEQLEQVVSKLQDKANNPSLLKGEIQLPKRLSSFLLKKREEFHGTIWNSLVSTYFTFKSTFSYNHLDFI